MNPSDTQSAVKALLDAQREWLAYRNGQYAFEGLVSCSRCMQPMLVPRCMAPFTKARTSELKPYIIGGE